MDSKEIAQLLKKNKKKVIAATGAALGAALLAPEALAKYHEYMGDKTADEIPNAMRRAVKRYIGPKAADMVEDDIQRQVNQLKRMGKNKADFMRDKDQIEDIIKMRKDELEEMPGSARRVMELTKKTLTHYGKAHESKEYSLARKIFGEKQ